MIRMQIPCDRCGKEAILFQPYSGRHLCARHFIRDFESRAKHEIRRHRWIAPGDRIAIGMSGGKDSSALAFFLQKVFGERRDLSLFALSVDEGIEGYRRMDRIQMIAEEIGIGWHATSFREHFGVTLDQVTGTGYGEHPCSCCGVLRRQALNRTARDLGATKLALGFNLDDEAQSVLMNVLGGDVARLLRPRVRREGLVPRIKPFMTIPEREVALYAMLHLRQLESVRCPHAHLALRNEVREFLNWYSLRHPATKFALVRLGETLSSGGHAGEAEGLAPCQFCGEPAGKECRSCRIVREVLGKGRRGADLLEGVR